MKTNKLLNWLCSHGIHLRMPLRHVECGCYQYQCTNCGATRPHQPTIDACNKPLPQQPAVLKVGDTFYDQRKRKWEIFNDMSCYDMICVRCLDCFDSKHFHAQMSFHFNTSMEACEFAELVRKSS